MKQTKILILLLILMAIILYLSYHNLIPEGIAMFSAVVLGAPTGIIISNLLNHNKWL